MLSVPPSSTGFVGTLPRGVPVASRTTPRNSTLSHEANGHSLTTSGPARHPGLGHGPCVMVGSQDDIVGSGCANTSDGAAESAITVVMEPSVSHLRVDIGGPPREGGTPSGSRHPLEAWGDYNGARRNPARQDASDYARSAPASRASRARSIFPVDVFGSASRNSTISGTM